MEEIEISSGSVISENSPLLPSPIFIRTYSRSPNLCRAVNKEEEANVAKQEPVIFYTNEPTTYECPNDHTIVLDEGADSKEDVPYLRVFRGYCPTCEDEWDDFVAEHMGNWEAILDENFPDDPSFFEWKAQRVVDWKRLTTIPTVHYGKDTPPADYPRSRKDFDVTFITNETARSSCWRGRVV